MGIFGRIRDIVKNPVVNILCPATLGLRAGFALGDKLNHSALGKDVYVPGKREK